MYATYRELCDLPPTAYLDPASFRTPLDALPKAGYADAQYATGRQAAMEYEEVGISANGTWYACSGSTYLSSCEGIGYHSCTADLLRGLLSGTARVVVYRASDPGIPTVIQEESPLPY